MFNSNKTELILLYLKFILYLLLTSKTINKNVELQRKCLL